MERARMNAAVRAFFAARGVLEVETPVLGEYGVTDPQVESVPVPGAGFLQPSPEYHMKRLLAAGSGPIYQLARVFRAGEQGRRHNPEFSLLEWYRPGFSLEDLIDECLALLDQLLETSSRETWTYRERFAHELGLDPLTTDLATLREQAGPDAPAFNERQPLLDWLLATRIEPALPRDRLVVLRDFPADAAALARIEPDTDGTPVARRFEVFCGGLELANGYDELTGATEQRDRFARDRQLRHNRGQSDLEPDPRLLAALEAGLPGCAGVAVGLDRVLMTRLGRDDIASVLTFPADRA
jgi:lysyl-tRNA synthetase class 2